MRANVLILFAVVVFFSLITTQAFSQEKAGTEEECGVLIEEWVLGDVTALDTENNQLTLSYVDYITDEGKEITISVNSDTSYENVSSLKDIEVGDVVAVDYETKSGGKALALNISVEKIEDLEE